LAFEIGSKINNLFVFSLSFCQAQRMQAFSKARGQPAARHVDNRQQDNVDNPQQGTWKTGSEARRQLAARHVDNPQQGT
jgi:hypothetical protein